MGVPGAGEIEKLPKGPRWGHWEWRLLQIAGGPLPDRTCTGVFFSSCV